MKKLACWLLLFAVGSTFAVLVVHACSPTVSAPRAHSSTFGLPPKGFHQPTVGLTAVPTVEMRDSVTVSAIPAGTRAVAGYTSGRWPTYLPLVRAFPSSDHVSIAISTLWHARCLDVEPGDATPSQAAGWVRADRGAGFKRPCLYANLSTMPAVKANLAMNGIARSSVFLWDADWTFRAHLDAGYDATQWTDKGPRGENFDESTVTLPFLGATLAPTRVRCFSHELLPSACRAVKRQVAGYRRAQARAERAYQAHGCPAIAQRVRWFGHYRNRPPVRKHASRARAYLSSLKAYRQRGCFEFTARANRFQRRIDRAETRA